MALAPGQLTVTLDFASDLKDVQLFRKQDPYCLVKVGSQEFIRSKTAKAGGKAPVWNQTFRYVG